MVPNLTDIRNCDFKALARAVTIVENKLDGYLDLLQNLENTAGGKVIGFTGPPGAGKSSLVDALIGEIVARDESVAVLCVDPSSPFNFGAVLGDRLRMSSWYLHPNVYIRSLASRGSLGGLHTMIIEITDLVREAKFDWIVVETVGVGQSEVEIAGLADVTVVVVVPEAGDEVQTMKAGIMEIADLFVVNKADRPDAEIFVKNLRSVTTHRNGIEDHVQVLKTVATRKEGIGELYDAIEEKCRKMQVNERKSWLMTQKLLHIIQQRRMADINRQEIHGIIKQNIGNPGFNLYKLAQSLS